MASILTPSGRGAVATVHVEGVDAAALTDEFFHPAGPRKLLSADTGRLVYGRWGSQSGEEVVACRRAADAVEIHCHGGNVAAQAIADDLQSRGANIVDWRTWVKGSERDPLAAAARAALAEAPSARTAAILLDQYQGALRRAMDRVIAALRAGELPTAAKMIDELLRYRPVGLHLTEPFRVVLAGRTNVGKSSLINRLVGYRRAIVFDAPGTTRDVVTAHTCLDGWPVELSDTAGLRAGGDPLEDEGIRRAEFLLPTADLILLVFDASNRWTDHDEALVRRYPLALIVHNKRDLCPELISGRPAGSYTSATTGEGLDELIAAVASRLVPDPPHPGDAVPFARDHFEALTNALAAVTRGDGAAALASLSGFRAPAR